MTKDIKYISWNTFKNKSDWYESQSFYGKVKKILTSIFTLPLDLVIPMTFFMITALGNKVFGKFININIDDKDW